MTREDAINIMKVIVHMLEEKYDTERVEDAVNMAIKSLEQEPCEDCVSRKDAIIQLSHNKTGNDDCDVIVQSDIETIKALPPVTPKQKIGHWKRISMDKYSEHAKYWYRCDRCGRDNLGNTNYCPNCGCAMKGELK